MTFQSLTINDGLSQGMVNQILQDRFGFMWFATKDGLNRYDGYHFKIFRHDTDDTSSVAESFIQSIYEDSEGRIWAGTTSGYVDYFDQASGKFRHVVPENNQAPELTDGPVNQITEDKQGKIWLVHFNKLYVISMTGKTGSLKKFMEQISLPGSMRSPHLFISTNGTIYLYNNYDPVFYIFQPVSRQWLKSQLPSDKIQKDSSGFINYGYHLVEDTVRKIIYAISSNGIYKLENTVAGKQLVAHPLFPVSETFIDKEGNIWISQPRSLGVYNIKTGRLNFITSPDETTQSVIGLLNSAYVDQSGLIWIGTKGYGLLTLNYDAHYFHHTEKSSLYSFFEDDDGRVGVNSGNNLMKFLDPLTGTFTDTIPVSKAKIYFDNFNEYSIPSFTDLKKRKWFADERRLAYYNMVTREHKTYPLPTKKSSGNYALVSDIKEDVHGKIWLGTTDGLLCFDPGSSAWTVFKNDPNDKTSLSFNSIFTLCFDPVEPAKYLWIGTNGGGLNRLDLSTGKCIRYSVKNGLPNQVIYGILPDNSNKLWISTNKGLSCFDPLKKTFKNYEEKDGLQSNEFNHNAYLRSKKGLLFFGGVNGFNYFNPEEIVGNPVAPRVVITDLRLRNKSVGVNEPGSPLKNTIYLEKKIVLPYDDNMITFEFAALDFIAPDKNQYKFKLEGFDKEWVNADNTNTTTYTNLDPGTYTFRVVGSNKDEVWSKQEASIQLIIAPPWYRTWWFRSMLVLMIVAIVYTIYKYRLNQALKLHAIRNSIARDLHDEIGSNLSNISIFSEVAEQQTGVASDTRPILKKINEYSRISMTAMSDIVWMINAKNDRFENIISRMRSLAAELFEAKHYQLHLDFDDQLNQLSLTMEERKNFYLIYKEAINNVAKYASCKNVWIRLTKENNTIKLMVRDDGIGFDRTVKNKGNGLYNMEQRAEALKGKLGIGSKPGEGTNIGLSFNC